MPTVDEFEQLITTKDNPNYKWEWKSFNGHKGWEITYRNNNNSIFLPAAGLRGGTERDFIGFKGLYWSSSLFSEVPSCAWGMRFDSKEVITHFANPRAMGYSIRPVTK